MNETFEKVYNDNNTNLNEDIALFEKVYTEAEMLNEMNPKLRALLAAGLIGTASLGVASCSMPTDDPTGYEQPAPENPSDNGGDTEDSEEIESSESSEDSEDFEDPEDPENPEDSENPVTFETLGVEEYAESLARAKKVLSRNSNREDKVAEFNVVPITKTNDIENIVYVYRNGHFEKALDKDEDAHDDASELGAVTYICYKESNIRYFVPISLENDFDTAIAA